MANLAVPSPSLPPTIIQSPRRFLPAPARRSDSAPHLQSLIVIFSTRPCPGELRSPYHSSLLTSHDVARSQSATDWSCDAPTSDATAPLLCFRLVNGEELLVGHEKSHQDCKIVVSSCARSVVFLEMLNQMFNDVEKHKKISKLF